MGEQEIMEVLHEPRIGGPRLKAAVFDFDGTISTLRHGWEGLMEPMMLGAIAPGKRITEDLRREVREYIDKSTGIQTIYQMQWLAETVRQRGLEPKDPWEYKADYNRMILALAEGRLAEVARGEKSADDFLVLGSREFLEALRRAGLLIYAASGTDHPDVVREAASLGVLALFHEITGAPPGVASCSKEAVLRRLIGKKNLTGAELAVIGDGKVEIALGREAGAVTIGVASEEDTRQGVNAAKRRRLAAAGADCIIGDFGCPGEFLSFLGL